MVLPKEEWIQHINKCFFQTSAHFLYHRNADVIETIEPIKKITFAFYYEKP